MVDGFTKRNHYNPCFWTALWNLAYFEAFIHRAASGQPAREQTIFALNCRSSKIYETKVDAVHYDKNLGVAEITPDAMKRFCKRWFPVEYERLATYVRDNPETLYMDFEDILKGIETKGRYDSLVEAARLGTFSSAEHKGFVTCVLVIQAMRSHEMMASMVEFAGAAGLEKWEYFWLLKNAWGNPLVLARAAAPLAAAKWVLYRTDQHCFPLCDSPVMINRDTLMAVLSPRLLVEIHLNTSAREDSWTTRDGISSSKYREFQRRSIQNTFKELVFSVREELEEWQRLPEFKARVATLGNPDAERQLIANGANRVIWALNGFGRVPPEFETWAKDRFDA